MSIDRNHYFDYFLKGFTVLSFILQLETYQQVTFLSDLIWDEVYHFLAYAANLKQRYTR